MPIDAFPSAAHLLLIAVRFSWVAAAESSKNAYDKFRHVLRKTEATRIATRV